MTSRAFFLGGVALAVMAGVLVSGSSVVSAAGASAPFLMAQAGDQDPFWGRLFNRPGEKPDKDAPKPLFLDRQTVPRASSDRKEIAPHSTYMQGLEGRSKSAAKRDEDREIAENRARLLPLEIETKMMTDEMLELVRAQNARIEANALQKLANSLRSSKKEEKVPVQQVYDPAKVWSYNPNDRGDAAVGEPRIYNTR